MSNQPDDEVLFVYDVNETENGVFNYGHTFTFSDGTTLTVIATVKEPPRQDMTTQEVQTYDVTGADLGKQSDNGALEAWELSRQTTAYRLVDQITEQVLSTSERGKTECPTCGGDGNCQSCEGAGCVDCKNSGNCPTCDGRGEVLADA